MIDRIRLTLCVAAVLLLQICIVHRFTHGALRPDLLYLVVIYLAFTARRNGALAAAFGIGLLRDLCSVGIVGLSPLLFLPATGVVLVLRDRLLRDNLWTDFLLTFGCVLCCGLAAALVTAFLTPGADAPPLLLRALGQAAFTTALSPLVYGVLGKLGVVDESAVFLQV